MTTTTPAYTVQRALATVPVSALTAVSVHEFAVPVVRETPLARREPAWVTSMW